jgi:RNA polymerase sigma-70 factor (ECF subfamily)
MLDSSAAGCSDANAINYRTYALRLLSGLIGKGKFLTRGDYERFTDNQLVAITLRGDNRAYEMLVRRYQKLVYNVVYQLVQNHEYAADITQDTFIKTFRALASFRQDAAFKPWLLRIASNTGLNKLRDEAQRRHESLGWSDDDDEPMVDVPSKVNVEQEVELRLSQAALIDALKQLPARRRHVFLLCYQHDLSYAEIATITGETESSIKALLFRTREQLRKMLQEVPSGN